MEKKTITEALSEINLINKKIVSKQQKIQSVLVRFEHQKDPYESSGGSEKMISEETQSMNDLMAKLARTRSAISQANISNIININGRERSIHDWLTWKREIAKNEIAFTQNISVSLKAFMDNAAKQPQLVKKDESSLPELAKLHVNTDYAFWIKKHEELTEIFEKLDGQLSLKNATIFVEV